MRVFALVARNDGSLAPREVRGRDGLAIEIHADSVPLTEGQSLSPDHIKLTGVDNREAKTAAARGAWLAYSHLNEIGLVHRDSDIRSKGLTLDLAGDAVISGSSAGLAFLVAMAGRIVEEHLRLASKPCPEIRVAATGVISSIAGGDAPIGDVTSLPEKLEAGAEAVGKNGYLMYPATADVGSAARDARFVPVATPIEAIDRVLAMYGLTAPPSQRRFRRLVGVGTATVAVIGSILALASWSQPTQPSRPKPCDVKMAVFRQGASGAPRIVTPNASLGTNDYIRIRLRLAQDCFAYVLSVDPNLRAQGLLPSEDAGTIRVQGEVWVPSESEWFGLTDAAGAERLIAIGATQRLPWLEDLMDGFDEAAELGLTAQSAIVDRLEDRLVKEKDSGKLGYTKFTFDHR